MTLENLLRIGSLKEHPVERCAQEARQLLEDIEGWLAAFRPRFNA